MSKDTYMSAKRTWASIVAAILLACIQLYAFMEGMQIGDNTKWIGALLWVALFLIQMVGNDFAQEDSVFFAGWVFSYILEVFAGTWAFYNLLEIPETTEVMIVVRWGFALGLSGVVAFLPERLLMLAITKPKAKPAPVAPSKSQPKPWTSPSGAGNKPGGGNVFAKFNGAKKYDPLDKPSGEPTYRPLERK